ncbi:MAG TPA: DUF4249 domain-containing protein [Cyclobacteriaceae bacterium]|nr:DUF4249 domain-containing protein [Cyclobacteriaceae bacterium]
MKRISNHIILLSILLLMSMCLTEIDLEQIDTEDLLVVDARLTSEPEKQMVILSRTKPLNSMDAAEPVTGATVWIESENANRLNFQESSPGHYESSNPFAAQPNTNYSLHIITSEGDEYQSDPTAMVPTPQFDSLYAEFEPAPTPTNPFAGFFNFYIDSRSNPDQVKYFRWEWNSTYQLEVPMPSRWLWTGGNNFVIRELGSPNDSLQVQICWSSDSAKDINIKALLDGENEVIRQPIHRFHSDSGFLKLRYSILVKQFALTEESYRFWNMINESNNQGFLFDIQVGTITGNLHNVANATETVLGYFDVVQERTVRQFYAPRDFQKDGYRVLDPFFVNCFNEEPILLPADQIGEFMERNQFAYSLCYFLSPATAVFCKIRCADCTYHDGSNKRPDFWE